MPGIGVTKAKFWELKTFEFRIKSTIVKHWAPHTNSVCVLSANLSYILSKPGLSLMWFYLFSQVLFKISHPYVIHLQSSNFNQPFLNFECLLGAIKLESFRYAHYCSKVWGQYDFMCFFLFYLMSSGVSSGQCLSGQSSRHHLLGIPGQGEDLPPNGSFNSSGVLHKARQAPL